MSSRLPDDLRVLPDDPVEGVDEEVHDVEGEGPLRRDALPTPSALLRTAPSKEIAFFL